VDRKDFFFSVLYNSHLAPAFTVPTNYEDALYPDDHPV